MKKTLAFALAGILVLSLVSCGRNETEKETKSYTTGESSEYVTDWEEPVAGIANPWIDTDAETIKEKCGNTFGVPENAENIVYRWCEEEELAEMQFVCDGVEWNARMKKIPVFEDISGMDYQWESETTVDVLPITGFLYTFHGEGKVAESVLWQDDATIREEYMLSLSCVTENGADLSIAKEIFTVHQH